MVCNCNHSKRDRHSTIAGPGTSFCLPGCLVGHPISLAFLCFPFLLSFLFFPFLIQPITPPHPSKSLFKMEEKKKSTIGKAFSRTFGRKSTTPQASTPAPAAAPITVAAPVAAPATAPVAAPVAAPVEKPIEAASNGALAPPHSNGSSNGNPFSPISIATPNMTTISPPDSSNISRVASPTHDSPKSPINSSMHMRDGTAMSNSSTMSRHGLSGEDGEGLNPADILMNRLVAFRSVIKNLQQYYTEVAQVETGVSKAMHKASGVITVPFKDGQQFLGKGGLQDVCAGIRDSAKLQSDQHASAARFVEETIVKNLRRLKQDIKGKIKALKSDTSLYSNRVFKERELTQEKIATLAKAIGLFDMSGQHQPDMEKMQSDPFIINLGKFTVTILVIARFCRTHCFRHFVAVFVCR